jgi:hypothetical protein
VSEHDNEENTANREHDLSDRPGYDSSEPEPTTQSEIAAMRMMMEEQRENQLHTVDRDDFKYRQLD